MIEYFFDPSQLPANLSQYAQFIRPNAGTGLTDASGNFSVTVGTDAANTGLVTNTDPLPDLFPIYNVGSSGDTCRRCPAPTAATTWPRSVVSDQSGNQSNPSAQLPVARSSLTTRRPRLQFVSSRSPAR